VFADRYVHGGWSKDYEALPPAAIDVPVDPDELVPLLLEALRDRPVAAAKRDALSKAAPKESAPASDAIDMVSANKALRRALGDDEACLIACRSARITASWPSTIRWTISAATAAAASAPARA